MDQSIQRKVFNAFSRTSSKIYLRTSEIESIKQFLKGTDDILHICGNPGTGKTVVVKHILKRTKHTFYNFLENENIKYRSSKNKIIVIDEFDKFYIHKPSECKRLFHFIHQKKYKLITLSNSLNIFENILYFTEYTTDDLIFIVNRKLDEIKEIQADDSVIKYVVMKGKGDLRRIFDACKCVIERCLEDGRKKIEMKDVVEEKENYSETGLNHQIVYEIVSLKIKGSNKMVYESYVNTCKEKKIPQLNRTDFFILYDMYKEM